MRQVPVLALLFILAIMIPTDMSFEVGPLRLTFYRVFLIIALFPSAYVVFAGRRGRVIASDWLMLFFAVWGPLCLLKHHGPETATETGGIFFIEALAPYLFARVVVSDENKSRSLAAALCAIVCTLTVFTVPEMLTGNHFIRTAFAALQGKGFSSPIEPRYGLHRAFASFDHPILWGSFAASAIGLSWCSFAAYDRITTTRLARTGAVVLGAFTAVSSGAMAAIMSQFLVLGWERVSRFLRRRWLVLTGILLAMYIGIDVLSNRSGMKVLLSYLTFSPGTAYGRLNIWHYGHQEVLRHPIFGIGLNDWIRPAWMVSSSVDNFWLLNSMRYGLPGGLAILVATIVLMARVGRQIARCPEQASKLLRFGWVVSMIGLSIAACTVHFWNAAFVYFGFMLGCGASLAAIEPRGRKRAPAARSQRASSTARSFVKAPTRP